MQQSLRHFSKITQLVLLLSPLVNASAAPPSDARQVNPIEVGASVPELSLTRADGSVVPLLELIADSPAILVFYRGGWCPFCQRHLAALGQIETELSELGYRIHAISPDRTQQVAQAAAAGDFGYSLYSDAQANAAKALLEAAGAAL